MIDRTEDLKHLDHLIDRVERRIEEVAGDEWLTHDYTSVYRDLLAADFTLVNLQRHAAVDEADYPVRS